jgi:hypothetical protein
MMTDTQQDVGKALQNAVLQAAVDEAVQKDSEAGLKNMEKTRVGDGTPGPGRPKGVQNSVTRTIREAVEKAARDCHAEGLAGWLIERAQGGIQDRQIFAQMVNKAMPLQVQANVDGGIKLELSWLGGRSIGTTTAQLPEQRTQVLDLEQDSDGGYRIKDPNGTPAGGGAGGAGMPDSAGGPQGA